MKKRDGRPTKYSEAVLLKTKQYIENSKDEIEEWHKSRGEKSNTFERLVRPQLPTLEGLAIELGLNTDTINEWKKIHPDFSVSLRYLMDTQKKMLMTGGLSGDYNPVIAKLILSANHGMSEKTETDVTSGGKPIMISFDSSFNN